MVHHGVLYELVLLNSETAVYDPPSEVSTLTMGTFNYDHVKKILMQICLKQLLSPTLERMFFTKLGL